MQLLPDLVVYRHNSHWVFTYYTGMWWYTTILRLGRGRCAWSDSGCLKNLLGTFSWLEIGRGFQNTRIAPKQCKCVCILSSLHSMAKTIDSIWELERGTPPPQKKTKKTNKLKFTLLLAPTQRCWNDYCRTNSLLGQINVNFTTRPPHF